MKINTAIYPFVILLTLSACTLRVGPYWVRIGQPVTVTDTPVPSETPTVIPMVESNTAPGLDPGEDEGTITDTFSQLLISAEFLENLLDEDWELGGNEVNNLGDDSNMPGMCSTFTSSLRQVSNCVNYVGAGFDMDYLAQTWYSIVWETIQPAGSYEHDVAFFGILEDTWVIEGYMLVDEYLFFVYIDGVRIDADALIPDALTPYVDDYAMEILLGNFANLTE